jgi:hypothetical protein
MVYLENTTEAQPLFIPRSRAEVVGDITLTLRSTVGLEIVVNAEAIDLNTSALYYRVAVALPADLAAGEYEYTLTDDTGKIATGVAFIGTLSRPTETDNTITYEQTEI